MVSIKSSRRWIVLACGVVAGGVLAGGVVAAQFREVGVPEQLEAAIDSEPLARVADIPADAGLPGRGVFVQPTSAGFVCLWDAPSATALARQGGCNPANDLFGGQTLMLSFAYEGGPAASDVRDARLVGLAATQVSAVELVMSDGSRRQVKLKKAPVGEVTYRAFGHRVKKADLRRGVAPTAVVALDAAGKEIDRQATGFAG